MGILGSLIGGAIGFLVPGGGAIGALIGSSLLGGAEDVIAGNKAGRAERRLINKSIEEVKRQKGESIEALGLRKDISEENLSAERRQANLEALFTRASHSRDTQLLQAQIRFQSSQGAGTFGETAEQALGTLSRRQSAAIDDQEIRRGQAFDLRAKQISTEFDLSTKAIEADERQRLINAESGVVASRNREAQGLNQAIGGFVNTALGAAGTGLLNRGGGITSSFFTSPSGASAAGASTGLGFGGDFTIGLG